MSSTATWTEHDLTVGANNLHYARMGVRSGPPVVLLHGFSDAGPCWIRFASDLATEYDLILPDAAGHGGSSAPTQGEALERQFAYWRQQLSAPLPALPLPSDRPRPAVLSSRGAHHPARLPRGLLEPLAGVW